MGAALGLLGAHEGHDRTRLRAGAGRRHDRADGRRIQEQALRPLDQGAVDAKKPPAPGGREAGGFVGMCADDRRYATTMNVMLAEKPAPPAAPGSSRAMPFAVPAAIVGAFSIVGSA